METTSSGRGCDRAVFLTWNDYTIGTESYKLLLSFLLQLQRMIIQLVRTNSHLEPSALLFPVTQTAPKIRLSVTHRPPKIRLSVTHRPPKIRLSLTHRPPKIRLSVTHRVPHVPPPPVARTLARLQVPWSTVTQTPARRTVKERAQ